jgi:4-hydroxy-tetrahydrodipicolinate reductase
MKPKVIVNGAKGRMGSLAVKAIQEDSELELVGATDHGDNLREAILNKKANIVVDLTVASVAYEMSLAIIEAGACPVIGTSGLLPEQINSIKELAAKKNISGVIAPNFAISAVLMMKFAQEAAKYLPDAEIIELHHDGKEDSPSGTALQTAQMIAKGRESSKTVQRKHEVLAHARGAELSGVSIHSVRLRGLNAHQEIIFGGLGQTLTMRSDVINRDAYMPGICLACKKVLSLNTVVVGLEHLL